MKQYGLFIGLITFLVLGLIGCVNEDKSKEQITSSVSKRKKELNESVEVNKSFGKAGEYAETLKFHRERLRKEEPLDVEILKNWYPETLENLKIEKITEGRSGFKNTSVANAFYTNGKEGLDIKSIKIELLDCAGEQGSMVTSNTLADTLIKRDASTPQYTNKWNERNGLDILEIHDLQKNRTTFTFVLYERFHFLVRAENMNPEETWNHISNLHFEQLPKS